MTQDIKIPSNQIIDIEFTFPDSNHWYRTSVSVSSYVSVMNSGLLYGKPIATVKLWGAAEAELGTCYLVYDFLLAKSGRSPFRNINE